MRISLRRKLKEYLLFQKSVLVTVLNQVKESEKFEKRDMINQGLGMLEMIKRIDEHVLKDENEQSK